MADRGRFNRDENRNSISVSELLAANKRSREIEQGQSAPPQSGPRRPGQRPPAARQRPARQRSGASGRAPEPIRSDAAEPTPGRTVPRVLGVAAAIAVLGAALVATQSFTTGNGGEETVHIASAPEHIRGAKVFQPDVIRASLNTSTDADQPLGEPAAGAEQPQNPAGDDPAEEAGAVGPADGAAPPADGGPDAPTAAEQPQVPVIPAPTAAPPPPVAPPAPTTTTRRPGGSGGSGGGSGGGLLDPVLDPLDPVLDPVLGPILGFYAAAPEQPVEAFGLLDPAVQEGTAEDFARSWDGVRGAEVENATPDGENAFIVQVALVRDDGSKMLTKQRIVVGDGPDAKIVDAQLLSVSLR